MTELYEKWKNRDDPYQFDNIMLVEVRKLMPKGYRLIMLSVAEARPWDEDMIKVVAVFVKPTSIIMGYTNENYSTVHDIIYRYIEIQGTKVDVTALSITTYIDFMLEGDLNMFFSFRSWARAWYIDKHMRDMCQKLHQYAMSRLVIENMLFTIRITLDTCKEEDWADHGSVAECIFLTGTVKEILLKNVVPKDHFTATRNLNHDIIDDVIFGRYKGYNFDAMYDYVTAQLAFLNEKVERTDIQEMPDIPFISGSVHQIRLMYSTD